ncbi:7tm 6 domain containing protein, partial [Asbolus verrucosus]
MKEFDWKLTIKSTILRFKIMGLWPEGNDTYKLNLYTLWSIFCVTLFTFGHCLFQAINIVFIFNDLEAVIATIYVTLSELLILIKAYLIIKNMKILKQLMVTLSSDLFQPRNDRQIELVKPALKFWKKVSSLFWIMASSTVFFWSTFPIFDNSIKYRRLPLLAWYPFNTKISPNYEITYAYQVIGSVFTVGTALCIDTMIAALNMYIGAQFDILCDDIRHLFDYKDDTLTDVNQKLIQCVTHHREILKFADNAKKFSSWIILGQFLISGISIGMTMFQLTKVVPLSSEFVSLITCLLSMTIEIFMYCWFGNEVEIKSNEMSYAIFESDWTDASMDMKKHIIFFVMGCHKPLKISALDLFYLSLDTFMGA